MLYIPRGLGSEKSPHWHTRDDPQEAVLNEVMMAQLLSHKYRRL